MRLIKGANAPRWGEARNAARPDIALMIEFLWETGLRVSEMTGIRLRDMKAAGNVYQIRIMGKGAKERWTKPRRELVEPNSSTSRGRHTFSSIMATRTRGATSR